MSSNPLTKICEARFRVRIILAVIVCAFAPRLVQGGGHWVQGEPIPGSNGLIYASIVWDDGNGEALYVGGAFTRIGGINASGVARWDGTEWSPVGDGIPLPYSEAKVSALAVYDGQLVAGGQFALYGPSLLRWNGSTWEFFAPDGNPHGVTDLIEYDGDLIVAHDDSTDDHDYVMRWDGNTWGQFGDRWELNGPLSDLIVFQNELYGNGWLTLEPHGGVVKWGGSHSIASAPGTFQPSSLGVRDGKLVAGTPTYYSPYAYRAHVYERQNDGTWLELGSGIEADSLPPCSVPWPDRCVGGVRTLIEYGGELFIGGVLFDTEFHPIRAWTGSDWAALSQQPDRVVYTATIFQGRLFVAGDFDTVDEVAAANIAAWDGTSWCGLPSTPTRLNGGVKAFGEFNGNLIAGGTFSRAGCNSANRIAQWNGTEWSPLGPASGTDGLVRTMDTFDGALVAAGSFATVGGVSAQNVASWDGFNWTELGGGTNSSVLALGAFQGSFIAAGSFTTAGTTACSNIARWDGNTWHTLGAGLNSSGRAVTIFDNELVVGGAFNTAGGVPANRVAAWNGLEWHALGGGTNGSVNALAVLGNQLVVAGAFTQADGQAANRIASWNGSAWASMGDGFDDQVLALVNHDGTLIAGGLFTSSGPLTVNHIAMWDGSSWLPLQGGADDKVEALLSFNGTLVAGGAFAQINGQDSAYWAQWVQTIPAASQWGLLAFAIAVIIAGTLKLRRTTQISQ